MLLMSIYYWLLYIIIISQLAFEVKLEKNQCSQEQYAEPTGRQEAVRQGWALLTRKKNCT